MNAEDRVLRVLAGLALNGYSVALKPDGEKLGAVVEFYERVPLSLLAILIAHEFNFEED